MPHSPPLNTQFLALTARVVIVSAIAIGGHLILADAFNLGADVGSVGAFVTAVGTLYSVLTAFTVVSVWTEFTDTDRAIKREAREMAELWRYVGYVSDATGVARARTAIEHYRDEVVATEWPAMLAGGPVDAAEDEFFEMADAVNAIAVTSMRDVPAWQEAVRTLGEVSDARSQRIVLVTLRMPRLLKFLLYSATVALVGGMSLLGFSSEVVGGAIIALTVGVALLVLEVIADIDDPFGGAWGVTAAPFSRVNFEPSGSFATDS
jgi:hypothetical protein